MHAEDCQQILMKLANTDTDAEPLGPRIDVYVTSLEPVGIQCQQRTGFCKTPVRFRAGVPWRRPPAEIDNTVDVVALINNWLP